MFIRRFLLAAAAVICAGGAISCGADEARRWEITKGDRIFVVRGKIVGGKDVSGVGSCDGRNVLLVGNETRAVQCAEVDAAAGTVHPGRSVALSAAAGEEMDLEAVAADKELHRYFAIGSHAASKKKGNLRPDQCGLYQIPDPLREPAAEEQVKRVSLTESLRKIPGISPYVGGSLQENGLNIEGLAYHDQNLYVGLRAPNLDGHCIVLEANADEIFKDSLKVAWKMHKLPCGPVQGIRDMAPVRDGFLILTGNAGSAPSGKSTKSENYDGDAAFKVYFWKPGEPEKLEEIGALGDVPGKAEGLLILEETDRNISILIFFDGTSNGRPASYKLTKPNSP